MTISVQNILFDFDGTLVDSEIVHREIWLDLLERHGKPRYLREEDYLGLPAYVIAKNLFGEALADQVHKLFEEQEISRDYQWMSGAEEFVRQLHNEGKKLAIVTNSRLEKVTGFLIKKGLSGIFDVIVTCDDIENRKPSPDAYLLALEQLNASPHNSIAIEDSTTGLVAARKAGLRYALVQPQSGYNQNTWRNILQDALSLSPQDFDLAYQKACILWDFHRVKDDLHPCDVIVGLGSYDAEVAKKCAALLQQGFAKHIIFTGKEGNWTAGKSGQTEASQFREIAIKEGVSPHKITLEEEATNIGQNIIFSQKIMQKRGWTSGIFVTKPQTTLRTRLTLEAQAPDINKASIVMSPDYLSMDNFLAKFGAAQLFNEMVGDIERIIKYPEHGFQAPTDIPKNVVDAFQTLKSLGFKQHMIK